LASRLQEARDDVERVREEKDQEIEILQAGMDATIEELTEAKAVSII